MAPVPHHRKQLAQGAQPDRYCRAMLRSRIASALHSTKHSRGCSAPRQQGNRRRGKGSAHESQEHARAVADHRARRTAAQRRADREQDRERDQPAVGSGAISTVQRARGRGHRIRPADRAPGVRSRRWILLPGPERHGAPRRDAALQAVVADSLRLVQHTGLGGGTSRGRARGAVRSPLFRSECVRRPRSSPDPVRPHDRRGSRHAHGSSGDAGTNRITAPTRPSGTARSTSNPTCCRVPSSTTLPVPAGSLPCRRSSRPPATPWRILAGLLVKYGKLAPELHARAVFKRPQVMLEPGACFRTGDAPKPFYGRPIGPDRLLSKDARESLAAAGVHPVQAAFALAIPIVWQDGAKGLSECDSAPKTPSTTPTQPCRGAEPRAGSMGRLRSFQCPEVARTLSRARSAEHGFVVRAPENPESLRCLFQQLAQLAKADGHPESFDERLSIARTPVFDHRPQSTHIVPAA